MLKNAHTFCNRLAGHLDGITLAASFLLAVAFWFTLFRPLMWGFFGFIIVGAVAVYLSLCTYTWMQVALRLLVLPVEVLLVVLKGVLTDLLHRSKAADQDKTDC